MDSIIDHPISCTPSILFANWLLELTICSTAVRKKNWDKEFFVGYNTDSPGESSIFAWPNTYYEKKYSLP